MNSWGTNCFGLERVVNACCCWCRELIIRDPFNVDIQFIHKLIDPVGVHKHRLLVLTMVESSVRLLLAVFFINVDSFGFIGSGFISSIFCIFFLFFNSVYEHMKNAGLE